MIWYFLISVAFGWAMVSRKSAKAEAEHAMLIAQHVASELAWLRKAVARADDLDRLRADVVARSQDDAS